MRVASSLALLIAACGSSTSGTPVPDGAIDVTTADVSVPDGVVAPDGRVVDAPVIDAPVIDARIGPDGQLDGVCGGFPGLTCDGTQYCVWRDFSCGGADQLGMCTTRPQGCPANYAPVCGCDNQVYGNSCAAAIAGVDLSGAEGCTAPQGYFACGTQFCHDTVEYCQKTYGGAATSPPTFTCKPIPAACGDAPSCTCLAGEQCIMQCDMDHGNYTLTCLFP